MAHDSESKPVSKKVQYLFGLEDYTIRFKGKTIFVNFEEGKMLSVGYSAQSDQIYTLRLRTVGKNTSIL